MKAFCGTMLGIGFVCTVASAVVMGVTAWTHDKSHPLWAMAFAFGLVFTFGGFCGYFAQD